MSRRRTAIIALWSACLATSLWVVVHARYITDLSAFLPTHPTPLQTLLVDQLRAGPASRLVLIALEGGAARQRSAVSASMAQSLRHDADFSRVDNGELLSTDRDREFLFSHRYLLSDRVTRQRFSVEGLRAAVNDTIEDLASPAGLMLKSLVPNDPTGEMLWIIDRLARHKGPLTDDGVWISPDGLRTLLVAQTVAAGSDTDAQEDAIASVARAFTAALVAHPGSSAVHLHLSGPGVFAVAARAKIKNAATRLSVISSILVVSLLLFVYRSISALILGLLPVATAALVGIAMVAATFGAVHGITIGFGITLIGESVDYSIYFFIQSSSPEAEAPPPRWQQTLWPTVRLGMLTSVCGFASLLPAGFPGLAQLGLYSISGLLAAALVTRFVLPELLPQRFKIRDVSPLGLSLGRMRDGFRGSRLRTVILACSLAVAAAMVLFAHRDTLWDRELAALSPVPAAALRYDALLRADLGVANVLDLVIVSGPDLETVLVRAERAADTLQSLMETHVIGEFETPTTFLPSRATQKSRQDALPQGERLGEALRRATEGLSLASARLQPFVADVEAARRSPLLTANDLEGTSLAAGFAALVLHQGDRWSALLPLYAPESGPTTQPAIDLERVRAAIAAANLSQTTVLDFKTQTDSLYDSYLHEAMRLSLAGFLLMVALLAAALKSARRVLRVLLPLVLAVLSVAGVLVLTGRHLTLMHLIGMLLIVAVGSNYALFFDDSAERANRASNALTLASLAIANVGTVIGFGLLSFSQVPVLAALGMTVGPGAFLALLFSALGTPPSKETGIRA